MSLFELFVIACGLSMDAFAVAVLKGLASGPAGMRPVLTGLYFGSFQAVMPLIGYFLGTRFASMISRYDHWIAFALLVLIGIRMLRDARCGEDIPDASFTPSAMLPLSLATSIDALAVGAGFAFLDVRILPAAGLIGIVTFILSAAGVCLGSLSGARLKNRAETAGGVILILMGTKILPEHLL